MTRAAGRVFGDAKVVVGATGIYSQPKGFLRGHHHLLRHTVATAMASSSLFEVYLRLRPATSGDRFLDIEQPENEFPDHITIKPPENDRRKKAVERFAFTRVFAQDAAQVDVFEGTGMLPLIEGVLGAEGREGRDGLLATLGVTGSGKVRAACSSQHRV